MAEWVGQVFPRWFVMWGAYSRELWAYPMFNAPKGTIVHSDDPGDLTRIMRAVERGEPWADPGERVRTEPPEQRTSRRARRGA